MSDYTARDIHLLDQAYPDALADIEDYIGNPVHKRRLAEVGPEVFAAELTFDLSASFDKPMTLAGWAAIATVRLMECGKAWEEDTEMAYDQRDAARAMADELRAELDKVRAQLADTQKRAHTDAANLQQILRDKTALANERDALKQQVCLIVTCSDCGEALEWDGATPHFRNLDEAKDILDDEGWRLIDGKPMCGDCCHYEPHAFKPERPGGLTCERCDLEEDDHEPAAEQAEVAR